MADYPKFDPKHNTAPSKYTIDQVMTHTLTKTQNELLIKKMTSKYNFRMFIRYKWICCYPSKEFSKATDYERKVFKAVLNRNTFGGYRWRYFKTKNYWAIGPGPYGWTPGMNKTNKGFEVKVAR